MTNITRLRTSHTDITAMNISKNGSWLVCFSLVMLCLTLTACSSSSRHNNRSAQTPVSSQEVLTSARKPNANGQQSNTNDRRSAPAFDALQNDSSNAASASENNYQAKLLLDRARNSSITEQPQLQLNAVRLFFAANNPRDAAAILDRINPNALTPQEQQQYRVLTAKKLAFNQRNSEALQLLEQVNFPQLAPIEYRADYYSIRAQSEFAIGNKDQAMIALLERENYLSRSELAGNQQRLWAIIDLSTPAEIANIQANTNSQALLDWLELATLSNQARGQAQNPAYRYEDDYQNQNNDLNGATLNDIPSAWSASSPRRIALLLPLSSQFGGAAKAFESGFRQAHRGNRANTINNSSNKPLIKTYDIGSNQQVANVVNQAITDGADFIVGPLGKTAAQSALDMSRPTVPMLALGGVIHHPSPMLNLFTLSPEQELSAIAQHALNKGHRNAAILFPNTPWGERHRNAFAQTWQARNGNLVAEQSYLAEAYDHGDTIKTLLSINASTRRHSRLSATLGFKPQFTPVRRSDIDFLVLIARSGPARIIKPQLSFHQAHDLPVYSTSAIYNGVADPANDADLDNVQFPEMPWLLSDSHNQNAGSSRLFAFGYDAYQLIPILSQLRLSDGLSYAGLSGRLFANSQGEIIRQPVWARFKKGMPEIEGAAPRYQLATPAASNTSPSGLPSSAQVIDRSSRYDSKNWDSGANRRKESR